LTFLSVIHRIGQGFFWRKRKCFQWELNISPSIEVSYGVLTISKDFSDNLIYIQELLGHTSSKTTEIYTHVSTKSLGKIISPLDNLDIKKVKKYEKKTGGKVRQRVFRQIENNRTRVQLSLQNRDYNCTTGAITNVLNEISGRKG
jgi:hypothetical protein